MAHSAGYVTVLYVYQHWRSSTNYDYNLVHIRLNSYYVPEDGDSEDHPNIFLMSKPTQSGFSPRLKDIRDSFPMPGKYHFRFKAPLIPGTDREKGAVAVWMDCTDDSQHVGVWRNTIFAKVTRINMDDDDFHEPAAAAPVPAPTQRRAQHAPAPAPSRAQPPQQQYPPQQQQHQHQHPTPARASENLLGDYHENPSVSSSGHTSEGNLFGDSAPAPVSTHSHGHGRESEGSLLDMNGPTYHSGNSNSNNSNHDVFMGMTSAPSPSPPVSAPVPAQVPAPAPNSYGNPLAGNGNGSGARPPAQHNAFSKSGPFGGLEWK
jgi:hypothetical protein